MNGPRAPLSIHALDAKLAGLMQLTANGHPLVVDPEHFGQLKDSADCARDAPRLLERFHEDGYVFIPGLIDAQIVLGARREILSKYAIIGEIDDRVDIMAATAGDRHAVLTANMRAFTESVRTGHIYESVILDDKLVRTVGSLLGGEARPFDFRWPRLVRPGEGCGFHCDGPYMNRGTRHQLSAWIPLGRVEPHESGLVLLENSHRSPDLHSGYLSKDADRDGLVWLDEDPVAVQNRYGGRWLASEYAPGDVLIFSMDTLHGALDNNSTQRRCRLSTDSRYYLAGEAPDPRWNGATINPHGPGRVFYPGLGRWANADFQDEWKYVDENGRIILPENDAESTPHGSYS